MHPARELLLLQIKIKEQLQTLSEPRMTPSQNLMTFSNQQYEL